MAPVVPQVVEAYVGSTLECAAAATGKKAQGHHGAFRCPSLCQNVWRCTCLSPINNINIKRFERRGVALLENTRCMTSQKRTVIVQTGGVLFQGNQTHTYELVN
jgi:hypothetical protein